ncbi:hypothetical protein ACSU1N_03755 [Thermogladius sp. 4427co]|uniref:hypothetical protein n=1 Tax=Thermogladius sp. 4427co TaxID=3450718 RepID=UPI003F792FD6
MRHVTIDVLGVDYSIIGKIKKTIENILGNPACANGGFSVYSDGRSYALVFERNKTVYVDLFGDDGFVKTVLEGLKGVLPKERVYVRGFERLETLG